jgi:hypothetical protein
MSASLNFQIETQQGDLLCWAAVAASVSRFYNPLSQWTQCKVASSVLNSTACCQSLTPCNQDSFLETALQATTNLSSPPDFQIGFDQIKDQIDRNRPIGIRIAFSIHAGHFVVLCGYDDSTPGEEEVLLSDPAGSQTTVRFSDFLLPGGYPGSGMWTNSYLTQP